MSFTTANTAQDQAGSVNDTSGFFFKDPYELLAYNIILRIVKDFKRTRDPFTRESLLRWFDSSWGITVCDFIGINSVYMKEVLKRETAKKHIRNDYARAAKVYSKRSKEG